VIIVLIGPPGAGKGTQATYLAEILQGHIISTGALLRDEVKKKSSLGLQVADIINSGKLVSDDLLFKIIVEKMYGLNSKVVLFDGYPRTLGQVTQLQELAEEHSISALHFDVAPEVVKQRLLGRLTCSECGGTFHTIFAAPKAEGKCDFCGNDLIQRKDDSALKVAKRLGVYEKETKPILDFYKGLGAYKRIDANSSRESVRCALEEWVTEISKK